jgi:hypothetical protein
MLCWLSQQEGLCSDLLAILLDFSRFKYSFSHHASAIMVTCVPIGAIMAEKYTRLIRELKLLKAYVEKIHRNYVHLQNLLRKVFVS